MTRLRIEVFDIPRNEWREFSAEPSYVEKVTCGNGLHQFAPFAKRCACSQVER